MSTLTAVSTNALLANCLDFDDTLHGHPGVVIVPTALAVGDSCRSSGADVLTAVPPDGMRAVVSGDPS